jgi:predicted DsbA family dithiol-disulfide isomerase
VSIAKLKKTYQINTLWRGFPLHPEVPEEGISVAALFANNPIDIENMRNRLKEVAAEVGLPLGYRDRVYNSRLAQELAFWAESNHKGDEFHAEVFKAYFVLGKNIGEIPVLVDVAASIGLPPEEAEDVLNSRVFKPAVDLDWSLSRKYNIRVVPTFVMNEHGLLGMQSYEMLKRFIESRGATKR